MQKNKLPRQSTHVDMTAMCDVAFLLLTFFMLATKFKPDEPVVVSTPTSISEIIIPENSILLTIDPKGKIYFGYDNKDAKRAMIKDMSQSRKLDLTPAEQENFVIGASYGGDLNQLKTYLALSPFDKKCFEFDGVPINDSADINANELVYWVQSARAAGDNVGKTPRICIKADAKTPYPKIKQVLNVLIENKIDRFNLITSAEGIPKGSAAYEERMKEGTGG